MPVLVLVFLFNVENIFPVVLEIGNLPRKRFERLQPIPAHYQGCMFGKIPENLSALLFSKDFGS